LEFFFPSVLNALAVPAVKKELSNRHEDFLLIQFGRIGVVVDVLWSQLYKTERSLKRLLRTHGFNVLRSASWSNERDLSTILFELEQASLPPVHKHLGPPVWRKEESKMFLNKHVGGVDTIAGPRVEGERWTVNRRRRFCNAVELLKVKMRDGGRDVGVGAKVATAGIKSLHIIINEEIVQLYRSDRGFAQFLTNYLKGRPFWLE
jgi:tRNA nucleotidyltransferase (CCA-adding enzyme)